MRVSSGTGKGTVAGTATHGGWTIIQSIGEKAPAAVSGIAGVDASVTLSWDSAVRSNGQSVTGYLVFRSTTSGQYSTTALSSTIPAASRSFTDSTVTGGTTYYYRLAVVGSSGELIQADGADAEIKVIVPPANMVLVHRWAANREMCGEMGRAVDRDQNYRCEYTGPGGNGSHYDIQKSFFIDTYETGCNYTPAPGCGDATNGCVGYAAAAPLMNSAEGDVFYNRGNGTCYINTSVGTGNTWTAANSGALSSSQLALIASNQPGLPPLGVMDQTRSYAACQALTAPGFGAKKLPRHSQQVLASAWPEELSNAEMSAIEYSATSLLTTGYCNTNSGAGLTYDNNAVPADLDTLPGCANGNCTVSPSTIRSVRTGSNATQNCVSRYGAQDLVGNLWEWGSDQLASCFNSSNDPGNYCLGQTSSLDPTNDDWEDFDFDGTTGPGGGLVDVTNWAFSDMAFSATHFLPALGLPVAGGAPASLDALEIGVGEGQFDPAKFRDDFFWLNTQNANGTPARASPAGGEWGSAERAGRYTLRLLRTPTYTAANHGFRCAVDAE